MPGQLPFEREERKKSVPIKRMNYTKSEFDEDMTALTNDVEKCADMALNRYYAEKVEQLKGSNSDHVRDTVVRDIQEAKADVKQEKQNTVDSLEHAQGLIDRAFGDDGVTIEDEKDAKSGRDSIITARRNWYEACKGMNRFSTPQNGQKMAKEQNHVVDGINTAAHNTVIRNSQSDIKEHGINGEIDVVKGAGSRYKGMHAVEPREDTVKPDDVIVAINASERGVGL